MLVSWLQILIAGTHEPGLQLLQAKSV